MVLDVNTGGLAKKQRRQSMVEDEGKSTGRAAEDLRLTNWYLVIRDRPFPFGISQDKMSLLIIGKPGSSF